MKHLIVCFVFLLVRSWEVEQPQACSGPGTPCLYDWNCCSNECNLDAFDKGSCQ